LPGGEFVIHQFLMFLKVFMLSPLLGGSGLKANPDGNRDFNPYVPWSQAPAHQKKAIAAFGGYLNMKAYRV